MQEHAVGESTGLLMLRQIKWGRWQVPAGEPSLQEALGIYAEVLMTGGLR